MWSFLSQLNFFNKEEENKENIKMLQHEMLKCFDGTDPERCLSVLMSIFKKYGYILIFLGAAPVALIIFKKIYTLWKKLQERCLDSKDPLRHMKIIEAKCPESSKLLTGMLSDRVYPREKLKAVGFDCEWVMEGPKQRPVSLLQLAAADGTCGLFRLRMLKEVPPELQYILKDESIIKLGVCPFDDARYLMKDYGVEVKGCLDIRHLFPNHSGGLGTLSKDILGVTLDKDWQIRCSNWEEENLTERQLEYAAKDALVAVEMFKKWLRDHPKSKISSRLNGDYQTMMDEVKNEVYRYVDVPFHPQKLESPKNVSKSPNQPRRQIPNEISAESKRGFAIRKSPLYHNCFMYAPDGELLCSCDVRKAEWYVEKGLAEKVHGEPFSIKLLFEPSGRAGNKDEGRYYTQLKQNRCVVCGVENSYLRHKVIPREYRKHFPSIMKDHQSHDVVLTCLKCHRLASLHDETLREKLAVMCDAPINNHKMLNLKTAKKIQSAAKALLSSSNIPPERRRIIEAEIKKFYKINEVTPEVLQNCLNLETKVINEEYRPHGLKVVEYFINKNGGILELEKMWRQHFLDTMNPEFLPALWSITHNHERLAERAARNRVKTSDLEIAGFQAEIVKENQESQGLQA